MSSNRLKLNFLKTELIRLHSSRKNPTFLQKNIVLFGSPITPVNVVRDLGVILNENMTISEHIARVYRNCYYQHRQIRRTKRSLTANSKTLLVLVFVHSRLDYCKSVLYSLPRSRLQLLQSVLNSAARLIGGLKSLDHISPVLIVLHWLPYPQRINNKVCMQIFECLSGLASAYHVAFCSQGSAVSGRSTLRSAVRGDLVVPSHMTDWGLRAFAVAGPSCWNELPVDLRDMAVGPATFAKHSKTHLFRVVFFPDRVRTFEFV